MEAPRVPRQAYCGPPKRYFGRKPGLLGLTLVAALKRAWPQTFDFAATRALIGSDAVWEALGSEADPAQALSLARQQIGTFAPKRTRYLIY